jgi:hypothetical protein
LQGWLNAFGGLYQPGLTDNVISENLLWRWVCAELVPVRISFARALPGGFCSYFDSWRGLTSLFTGLEMQHQSPMMVQMQLPQMLEAHRQN